LDNRPVLRTFGVEDVAGNDDVLCPVFDRRAPKCVDCLEPRLAEAGPDFGLEVPIRFAELPVSRMDEFQYAPPPGQDFPILAMRGTFSAAAGSILTDRTMFGTYKKYCCPFVGVFA